MKINLLPRNIAVAIISFYQSQISSYKGFKCAYASLHKDSSCSKYGKEVIHKRGVLKGLTLLRYRFRECRRAAFQIQMIACLLILSSCDQIDTSSWNLPILYGKDDNCACVEPCGQGIGSGCATGCFG